MLPQPFGGDPFLSHTNRSTAVQSQRIDLLPRVAVSEVHGIASPRDERQADFRKDRLAPFFHVVEIHDQRPDPLASLRDVRPAARITTDLIPQNLKPFTVIHRPSQQLRQPRIKTSDKVVLLKVRR